MPDEIHVFGAVFETFEDALAIERGHSALWMKGTFDFNHNNKKKKILKVNWV